MASSSTGTVRVETAGERMALVEFLVEKRLRFLGYLKDVHTADSRSGVLWMGTVRLRRADVLSYFRADPAIVAQAARQRTGPAPPPSQPLSPPMAATPLQTSAHDDPLLRTAGDLALPGGSFGSQPSEEHLSPRSTATVSSAPPPVAHLSPPPASHRRVPSTLPEPTLLAATADPSWLAAHTPRWFLLGVATDRLLRSPKLVAPDAFAEAVLQLLMEADIFLERPGSAGKLMGMRSLRTHREEHPGYWHSALSVAASPLGHGEATDQVRFEQLLAGVADRAETAGLHKYHFLDLAPAAAMCAVPCYEAVVPALCAALCMVYQRLGDLDGLAEPGACSRIVAIDRRLKHLFFGPVSRELAVLARAKVAQQIALLSSAVLAPAYSDASSPSHHGLFRDALLYTDEHPVEGGREHLPRGLAESPTLQPRRHADPSTKDHFYAYD